MCLLEVPVRITTHVVVSEFVRGHLLERLLHGHVVGRPVLVSTGYLPIVRVNETVSRGSSVEVRFFNASLGRLMLLFG